ncbi:MAG: hypothetical protein ACREDR_15895, partial [Blastocatellia bacterium]
HQAAQLRQTVEGYLDQLTQGSGAERDIVRTRLLARGLLVTWPGPRSEVPEHPPMTIKGQPLSQTVIEDRR